MRFRTWIKCFLEGEYGYIDTEGSYVINPQFDSADSFTDNGLARVESGDKYGYIDTEGSYVINPQFDYAYAFENGVAIVKMGDKYGVIDAHGKYIANPIYNDIKTSYHSDLICFEDSNGKIGYLNTSGEEVIPAQFDSLVSGFLSSFELCDYMFNFWDDGYAIVRMGDAVGVIDKTGKYIINPQFDDLWTQLQHD